MTERDHTLEPFRSLLHHRRHPHMTGGEAADSPRFVTLMDLGPDVQPRAAVADKGYDSTANRQIARRHGAVPVIPYRRNTRTRPGFFAEALYRGRARIEQAVGKLKRFKRIALRGEADLAEHRRVRDLPNPCNREFLCSLLCSLSPNNDLGRLIRVGPKNKPGEVSNADIDHTMEGRADGGGVRRTCRSGLAASDRRGAGR